MICSFNYFIKNPKATFALTFLTHIISAIGGVGFVYHLLKKTKTENAFVYKKNYIVSVEKKKIIVLSSECVLLFRSKTIQRNKRRIFKEKLLLKGFVNPYEIVPNISKVIKFKKFISLRVFYRV